MFVFDVETLGKDSSSVILSMACLYFNPEEKKSYQELIDSAFFVKLDAEDQMLRLKRTSKRSTIEWWAKQCDNVRSKSFDISPSDVIFEDGYEKLREWAESKNDKKCYVWARGNLDQLIVDSFEEQLGIQPIWPFPRWRDVRTAIDIFYNTKNGYCKVDYLGFDPSLHITKHCPTDDCIYDIMQLIYGKEE
jgi:hypothetical protein